MKRIVAALVCVLGMSTALYADSGDLALGLQMVNGSSLNQMGLGVKVQCSLYDQLRLEPSFTYYFEKNSVSTWDIAINLHYVVSVTSNFEAYPLIGLGYSRWTTDFGGGVSSDDDRIFADLGAGFDFAASKNLWFTTELRYELMADYGQFVPAVGVKVCF